MADYSYDPGNQGASSFKACKTTSRLGPINSGNRCHGDLDLGLSSEPFFVQLRVDEEYVNYVSVRRYFRYQTELFQKLNRVSIPISIEELSHSSNCS